MSERSININDEIDVSFASYEAWREWHVEHPFVFESAYVDGIVRSIVSQGFIEPLTGQQVAPDLISHLEGSRREGLIFHGINSRARAVMRLIELNFGLTAASNLRIYAPEAITAFALRLREIFPRFLGSEFSDDELLRRQLYPIPCQDLMALTLPDDTFDLVSSNEVLEHVPDLDKALSEICRVLKPSGWHIGTCPFAFMHERSIRKARLENGQVIHLMEPEYHGNPMSPNGSLVFEIPGWDILQRCKAAGFTSAAMRFVVSKTYGCVSEHVGGIFVLTCHK